MNLKKLFFMLTFFVLLGTTAFAQTYVSATNGDDAFGTGSIATPYRSITKAISVTATGGTISVEAGVYSAGLTGETDPVTVAAAKTLTFVGTSVGLNTTVTITNGFVVNHASAVVNMGLTGTASFNLGTTVDALTLTAGAMNIVTANVILGSGATITFTAGTLNTVPTTGANTNATFNGTAAVGSTSAFLPSSLGTGLLTINKASGAITIDNASLTTNGITINNVATVTINSNITSTANIAVSAAATVNLNGNVTMGTATSGAQVDITNTTGTVSIGASSANTLTLYTTVAAATVGTDANVGEVKNTGAGTITINSTVTENIKNTGTVADAGDQTALTVTLPLFSSSSTGSITVNGNVTFNNTNVIGSTAATNQVAHTVTLSNSNTGTLAFAGSITTPASALAWTTPANVFINVKLSNTGGGAFTTRAAALRGVAGTEGISNKTAGNSLMTLGQVGDAFTCAYDIVNNETGSVLTLNGTGTLGGALTNGGSGTPLVVLGANQTITGVVTNAASASIKLNSNTLTISATGAGALSNSGNIYSASSGVTGSGWVKFTGAAPTKTNTGAMPNVELANSTSFIVTGATTFWGDVLVSGAGTVTITGATTIKGNFTTGAGAVTITPTTAINGNLNVSGAGTITVNGATTVSGAVNMTVGNITLGANNLTVTGTFNMSAGTFTFGANILNLGGNFNRTGGTIDATAAGTGTLNFAGTANQTFTPGTQMNVYKVTVNNTGNYILNVVDDNNVTINASLIVLNDFTITTGRVILGTSNIRMTQVAPANSSRFTNGGRGYSASGIGGIIFEGSGTNANNVTTDGPVITGTLPYSNIYARLTDNTKDITCVGAVTISGNITLDAGGIRFDGPDDSGTGGENYIGSSLTIDQTLTGTAYPTVAVNTGNSFANDLLLDGGGGAAGLTITTRYNLTYTGTASKTATGEFVTAKINNLSIETTTGRTLTIPAAAATVKGAVNVNATEFLDLNTQTLTADGSVTHTVNGTVQNGTFAITGSAATLTGGVGTTNASSVSTLTVTNAAGTFTSTGMKVLSAVTINGAALTSNITMNSASAAITTFTNTAGTTNLNMNSTVSGIGGAFIVTAGAVTLTMNGGAAGTRTLATTLAVNGGSLTLGSHVNVTGAVTHNGAGIINLGDYNLTIADAYTHASTATFTAGTGNLVSTGAGVSYTFTTTVTIPNWTVNSAGTITFVTAGATVSNSFRYQLGTLALATFPLTISGNTIRYDAGTITTTGATAIVTLSGSNPTATLYTDWTIPYLTINTVGTLTVATDDLTTPTARILTVGTTFTHTKGNIVLGINDLALSGTASYTTSATAGTVTGTATGANLGEVAFNTGAHTLTLAANYAIQNIRFDANTTTRAADTFTLTVSDNVGLNGGSFTTAATEPFVLGAGATITRLAGTFALAPTFGTTVNLVYTAPGALSTNKELPASTTVLNNLTVNTGGILTFTASSPATGSATVNGTLFMTAGAIDLTTNTKVLTIANGATINRSAGTWNAGTDAPTVTSYTLVYSGTAAPLTTAQELISTSCTSLTVSMTGGGVLLSADRTVGSFTMSPTGAGAAAVYFRVGTDAALRTFTVNGATIINNGIVSTQDATAAVSTSASTFVVKGSLAVNGGSFGNLGTDNGAGTDGGLNVTFNGSVAQNVTLAGDTTIPNITLNSTGTTAANSIINVTGGNLTITNLITFQNGILNMGSNILYLPRPTGAANGGLAFDRSAVTVGKFGNVVGKISRPANSNDGAGATNGRFEFPSGTSTGEYRPAAITFTPAYVVNNPVSIEVNHIASTPEGTVGLPLNGGNNVTIGNYAPFYWLVNTTPSSLSSTQNFDIDLQANNIGVPYTSDQSLRIVRRQDGSATTNGWSMQGTAANYANYQVVTGTDTTVVARTTSSQGGLVLQGSRFAIGVPARAPNFTAPVLATFTVAEGATSANTVQFTAVGLNTNDGAITYSKVSGPTWASVNATTGLATLTPGYSDYSATVYSLVVRATTATALTTDKTVTITVTNTNRAPDFTATGNSKLAATMSITNTSTALTDISYVAPDPDGDAVTYSLAQPLVSTVGAVTFAGTVSFNNVAGVGKLNMVPAFADAGKTFTVAVTATDVNGGTNVTTSLVTVTFAQLKGDADLDGVILALDAAKILQYVVGLYTPTNLTVWNYVSDVNLSGVGDGTVGAIDAAAILYRVNQTPNAWPTTFKSMPVAGDVDFGKMNRDNGNFTLPINLTNTSGVRSAYIELELGNSLEFNGVTSTLPEGWITASNYANGKLRIAMSGVNPLADGSVAFVKLALKDKEVVASIQGSASLNDQVNSQLMVKVKEIPTAFGLSQNYPNPFNPTTNIKYTLSVDAKVTLTVYNMLGQRVKTLVDLEQESGYYTVRWDGTNEIGSRVSSGIYIYRLSAGNFVSTIKMNLLK